MKNDNMKNKGNKKNVHNIDKRNNRKYNRIDEKNHQDNDKHHNENFKQKREKVSVKDIVFVLVGPSGVGKSHLVNQLVHCLVSAPKTDQSPALTLSLCEEYERHKEKPSRRQGKSMNLATIMVERKLTATPSNAESRRTAMKYVLVRLEGQEVVQTLILWNLPGEEPSTTRAELRTNILEENTLVSKWIAAVNVQVWELAGLWAEGEQKVGRCSNSLA